MFPLFLPTAISLILYQTRPSLWVKQQPPTTTRCGAVQPRGQLDELWEQRPFQVVHRLVDRILQQSDMNEEDGTDLIRLVNQKEELDTPLVFSCFYRGKLPNITQSLTTTATNLTRHSRKMQTFRLDLAYQGTSFCGWQSQGRAPTVLPAVQDVLKQALDDKDIRVAGRTDAGVHAYLQVARVRMNAQVVAEDLHRHLNQQAAEFRDANETRSWKCWRVVPQDMKFHPTFHAQNRSYCYILDGSELQKYFGMANQSLNQQDERTCLKQLVQRLNIMFQPLVGQELDFVGMSYGKVKTENTMCTISHLRAVLGQEVSSDLPCSFVAIELTANRFLRRMIRILVATALTQSLSLSSHDSSGLRDLVFEKNRSLSAHAAPPEGLVFLGAEFEEFGDNS